MASTAETAGQRIPVAEAVEEAWFDSFEAAEYAPELYQYATVADGVSAFGDLTDEHVERFREQGYLVVHHAFSAPEVHAAMEGLLDLIDGKNPAFKGIQFEAKAYPLLHTLPREQKQGYVRKVQGYLNHERRLRAIAENPQLLPGTHREGAVPHFRRRDWQICDSDVATTRIVAVPSEEERLAVFGGAARGLTC